MAGEINGVHNFPKSISLKMNAMAWLELEIVAQLSQVGLPEKERKEGKTNGLERKKERKKENKKERKRRKYFKRKNERKSLKECK